MIKYSLICGGSHEFEAWFQSSAAFDQLAERNLLSCSVCGSPEVSKAIMAPSVATRGDAPAPPGEPRFAEEARKIHSAESPERGIYGEASPEDVKALAEDGIPFFPLPPVPDEMN